VALKNILVPYDGSKPSESALKLAVSLAASLKNGGEITLLTVVQQVVLPPMIESPHFKSKITGEEMNAAGLAKELYKEMKEIAYKTLEAKKQQAAKDLEGAEFAVKTKVLVGYPVEEIVAYADSERADLIVIGNTGLSGISKLKSLGSVSRGVAERAGCPVLIAH
jgi:nucleotide-binding universal stress UspA family protein